MRFTTREHTQQVANNLARSIEDVDAKVEAIVVGSIWNQDIWGVQVSIANGPTLLYTPWEIDNGAEGVNLSILVGIRQAAGEDIELPPVRSTENRKYFSDLITLDPIKPEDLE